MYDTKQSALEKVNFSYLDIFERQNRIHRQAQDEFYQEQQKEDIENDAKKPALFRKYD